MVTSPDQTRRLALTFPCKARLLCPTADRGGNVTRAMQRLTYVLRFHRPPSDGGAEAATTAQGTVVTTHIKATGVTSQVAPIDGGTATLDLQYAQNGDQTLFFEWGTVTFDDDAASSLMFASIGAGTIGAADVDGFSHGTVMYCVDAGTGQFEGATGLITSNFLVDTTTNELVDTQLGIIRLP